MGRPYIVLGDMTDHGGQVIEGDPTATIDGKPIARVGDRVSCPKCKGVFPITTGADDMIFHDKAVARHGDKTACGATLIASQTRAKWISAGPAAGGAAAKGPSSAAAIATKSAEVASVAKGGVCLECLAAAAQSGSATVARG